MELCLRNARYDDEGAPQKVEAVNFLAVGQLWDSSMSPT